MYDRLLKIQKNKSFFLFGPRGTGKTCWIRSHFPNGLYFDLLKTSLYTDLLANPSRLENLIPPDFDDWILLDEIQRIPALLNEVHRLIEGKHYKFVLTGSSARSLRRKGVNLLAGRALTYHMYPLTALELGCSFNLIDSIQYGHLPAVFSEEDRSAYLRSYVETYLREEVLQEGLTRSLGAFTRFLEVASFSQGEVVNISDIAREVGINRKVIESYFQIVEDLLLGQRIPVFSKRAKRRVIAHPKFYYFDVGVFRSLRPTGPMDTPEEVSGAALETLVYQELSAMNDYYDLGYDIFYWRTQTKLEVDFVFYGPNGFVAIEVKRSKSISPKDLKGLRQFGKDYPEAKLFLLYGGDREEYYNGIVVRPIEEALQNSLEILSKSI